VIARIHKRSRLSWFRRLFRGRRTRGSSNEMTIDVQVVGNASKKLRKINADAERLRKTLDGLNKSVKRFAKTMKQSGLTPENMHSGVTFTEMDLVKLKENSPED